MAFFKSSPKQPALPPNMQKAMNKQMQKAMGSAMSKSTQKIMAKQMQKSMNQYTKDYTKQMTRAEMMNYGSQPATSFEPQPVAPHAPYFNQPNLPASPVHPNPNSFFEAGSQAAMPNQPPVPNQPQPDQPPTLHSNQLSDPAQPAAEPPAEQFDFITQNNETPEQTSPLGGLRLAGMPKQRLLLFGASGALFLIILIVLFSLLTSKPATPDLISLAQEQTELVHISTSAEQNASEQNTKNLAVTAGLSLSSSQQQLLAYLKQNHQKISSKQLSSSISASTDQQLGDALASSDFDSVYTQTMQSLLNKYLLSIEQSLSLPTTNAHSQLLHAAAAAGTLLQTEANNNSVTVNNS
jgi:hypothetical protein